VTFLLSSVFISYEFRVCVCVCVCIVVPTILQPTWCSPTFISGVFKTDFVSLITKIGRNKRLKGNLRLVYSWFYPCCSFVVYCDVWTVSVRAYWCGKWEQTHAIFLISNFRRVLNVVRFLPGNSLASEFYFPTFRNTLFHLHGLPIRLWRWKKQGIPKLRHKKFRRQEITRKKTYKTRAANFSGTQPLKDMKFLEICGDWQHLHLQGATVGLLKPR